MMFPFEKLDAWQKAEDLAVEVYSLLPKFPATEQYALCQQIRRAVSSISLNIAEGSGRFSAKEKVRFIEIAFGSLRETYSQLHLAQRLGYLSEEELIPIYGQFVHLEKLLNGLSWFYKNQESEGNSN